MKLRHPNSRLLVFNLLHNERIRCNEALVKAAVESGLIKRHESLNGSVTKEDCRSLIAVDAIIRAYFEQSHSDMNPAGKSKAIMNTVESVNKDIQDYKLRTGISHPDHISCSPIECGTMAPAVFDFLLQHLHHFD